MDSLQTNPGPAQISPLEAFESDICPATVSPLYTGGLVVVALLLVLLPAIYMALIVLVGLGVVYHLTHHTWILSGSGAAFVKLILYIGPAVVGAILVFFMLKPLLVRQAKPPPPVSLDPAREPLLFAFVQRICQLVRAPMPSRIDVDCQVNASASLRRGLLSGDLVLTIGIPLVAGLTMRQFAGVLAHEFGHFTQGTAMRLTYVIRSINHWFARVVHERDRWDIALERTAKGADIRIAIVLHAARGCVWLTRRILWVLMHLGHAVSCFMMRQMEYDADAYEAKVAGSDAFASTAQRIRLMNVAAAYTLEDVRQSWAAGRLPENLPAVILHKATMLPAELQRELVQGGDSTKTRWFDTHPCDADRVKAASRLNESGVFRLERPATELFTDFTGTSEIVTRQQYAKHWGLEITTANLVASDEMLQESAANAEGDAAIGKLYGEVNINLSPLLTTAEFPPFADAAAAKAAWETARARSESLRPEAEKASAQCMGHQAQLADLTSACHLAAVGFKVKPKEFGLPEHITSPAEQHSAARSAIERAAEAFRRKLAPVDEFVAALRERATLALRLARRRGVSEQGESTEIEPLAHVLVALGTVLPLIHQIGMRLDAFLLLAQNRANHSKPEEVDAQMSRLAEQLQKLVSTIQTTLADVPYPFGHPRGQITVAQYAKYEKPCETDFEKVFQDGHAHVERLLALNHRALGRLLSIVVTAENNLEHEMLRTATQPDR